MEIERIREKVESGEPVDQKDAEFLFDSRDLLSIGSIADAVREKKNGSNVYFSCNVNINYTNVCVSKCPLCAFSRDSSEKDAYIMTLDEIEEKFSRYNVPGLDEVHIVGGLNPELKFEYYEEMLNRIKGINSKIFIHAFTAVELDFISGTCGIEMKDMLVRLKTAGLDGIPGGGAEIFSKRVRKDICPKKISGERWLEVMETAHSLGINSNATMLYGHVETNRERAEHLFKLRQLQERTNGFLSFVPLAFHPKNTNLVQVNSRPTAYDDLKILSVGRIVLHNFPHVKALHTTMGLRMAQVALNFGVDDLGGTSFDEKIVKSAGGKSSDGIGTSELEDMIRKIDRIPVKCASDYDTGKITRNYN